MLPDANSPEGQELIRKFWEERQAELDRVDAMIAEWITEDNADLDNYCNSYNIMDSEFHAYLDQVKLQKKNFDEKKALVDEWLRNNEK